MPAVIPITPGQLRPLWVGRELKSGHWRRSEGECVVGRRPGQPSAHLRRYVGCAGALVRLATQCVKRTRISHVLAWCGACFTPPSKPS